MSELADQRCEACRGGEPVLTSDELALFGRQVDGWDVVDGHHIEKRFSTADFQAALDLANAFGAIAEEQDHHPVLRVAWGWVEATIWTHAVDGLTVSDFVLAAKYDRGARRQAAGGSSGTSGPETPRANLAGRGDLE